MKAVLYNYDIFPKVFLGNREETVTIQPLGLHSAFTPGHEYTVKIYKVRESNPGRYPERGGRSTLTVIPNSDGSLRFTAYFQGEGEHFINIHTAPEEKQFCTLSVYTLAKDMAGRIPYRGDLHVHTCRSDGREAPTTVAAN
ncbi:MAG: hypothetical protein IJY04_07885 [Clostridia bacterium]|nr:hypothetical protein [Clostridia bacterium]